MIYNEVFLADLPKVAADIVDRLKENSNIAFYGNLGAGKTTLIKEICKIMGGDPHEVRSPTFTIINNYEWLDIDIVHIDFYRLDSDEADFLGINDYFEDDSTLVFMEWPEKAEDIMPSDVLKVSLEYLDIESRKIVVE